MSSLDLKIAFLSNQLSYGGAPKSLLLLIRAISKQRFKLYLFVTRCASEEMKMEIEKYVEFVKVIDLPELSSAQTETIKKNKQKIKFNLFNFEKVEQFAEELNQLGIDILHINNSVFSPIYDVIRTKTNVKIVSHIREWIAWNGIHEKQKFIIESIKMNSDAIICISNTEALPFTMMQNIFIIPNPFDFTEIGIIEKEKEQVKDELGLNNDFFLIGMIGRTKNKGAIDFLRTFAYLKGKYKDKVSSMKFIVLGENNPSPTNVLLLLFRKFLGKSNYTNDLYQILRKENLLNDVIFISNRKDALGLINTFDIAIRPSFSGDPWGRDIIEFMALKKPIIATGTSEFFITNGETGFLVQPGDTISLAEKIYDLFLSCDKRKEIGQKAYDSVYSLCNLERFGSEIIKIYDVLNHQENQK